MAAQLSTKWEVHLGTEKSIGEISPSNIRGKHTYPIQMNNQKQPYAAREFTERGSQKWILGTVMYLPTHEEMEMEMLKTKGRVAHPTHSLDLSNV